MSKKETDIKNFQIEPIAYIHTGFSEKFGIPRQSGLVKELTGRIVFEKKYRNAEALRGIEEFTHLWLIWQFSQAVSDEFRPTVRPPRLGGNERVGVFATRSPFRPNSLGLSCVKLESVDLTSPDGPTLTVSGIDMLDGTPIFDIKPYIPVADLHPEASEGYRKRTKEHKLSVIFEDGTNDILPKEIFTAVKGILENDPRPGYDNDPEKIYGIDYSGYDIGFRADGENVYVIRVKKK